MYPREWEKTHRHELGINLQVIILNKNSIRHKKEYDRVEARFRQNIDFKSTILKIERIQNKLLWQRYYFKQEHIKKKYEGMEGVTARLEVEYFHGSSRTAPEVIYNSSEGIDRRYTTLGVYGYGAYFANYSNYSAMDGFVHTCKDGTYQIFLAKVCPGVSTKDVNLRINKGSVLKINPQTGKRYDSVSDRPDDEKRQMFVTFSNDQSYPQWVITFTKEPLESETELESELEPESETECD